MCNFAFSAKTEYLQRAIRVFEPKSKCVMPINWYLKTIASFTFLSFAKSSEQCFTFSTVHPSTLKVKGHKDCIIMTRILFLAALSFITAAQRGDVCPFIESHQSDLRHCHLNHFPFHHPIGFSFINSGPSQCSGLRNGRFAISRTMG